VLLVAAVFSAILGVLIGVPTLRLRGDYLAIVTLGFGEIITIYANNLQSVTGGAGGTNVIPHLSVNLLGVKYHWKLDSLPYYYLLLVFVVAILVMFRALENSRVGRAWIAIREDETAAAAMGVPLMRTKTWSYALGAFFGGIAGAYYASFKSGAFPADFYFNISVFLLCMVILGGMGSIWGVTVGGMILAYLNFSGLSTIGSKIQDAGLDFDPTKYQFGIYGVIIVLMMLFRPAGLIPERRHKIELEEGVHDTPFYDVQTEGALTDRNPADD
jgi:branched-chain amino acid transport system permease protein